MINNVISLAEIDICDILKVRQKIFQDLDFCVDVGAAAGLFAQKILDINPQCEIYAYEPFVGNHPYLEKNLSDYQNVKIIKKALSNQPEKKKFYVDSVVEEGNTSFASDMLGYSSVGTFVGSSKQAKFILDVECTTLDHEITNQKINFLKMDVQSAELSVLQGGIKAIQRGIEIMFIEFSFQPYLLNFLRDHQYVLFDTEYVFTSQVTTDKLSQAGFQNIKQITLSTGSVAYKAIYQGNYDYLISPHFRNEFKIEWLQTDLICVDIRYFEVFMLLLGITIGSKCSLPINSQKLWDTINTIKQDNESKKLLTDLGISHDNNIIVFPDWKIESKTVFHNLKDIIKNIADNFPEKITLFIDTTNTDIADAEMMISEIIMNLLLEEELDIPDNFNISLLTELSNSQREYVKPYLKGRLPIANENTDMAAQFNLTTFNSIK